MQIVEYTRERFEDLQKAAAKIGPKSSLAHRPFVDYYYTANEWCRLYMGVADDGNVVATMCIDRMRFEYASKEIVTGFGGNFHSLQPGAGGFLWLKWLKSAPYVIVFGGSKDTHRLCRSQNFAYFSGVRIYILNKTFEAFEDEPLWRVAAKKLVESVGRRRISQFAGGISREIAERIMVQEEGGYAEDLLPSRSPFTFRFAPPIDYLAWRYNTKLSFARYRAFRILFRGSSAGYVILNESPSRILVAQCDGDDPAVLAQGVLISILKIGENDEEPRTVLLSSAHPAMQNIYKAFGFAECDERALAFKWAGGPIDFAPDTSNWLINLDWGDNGLRVPFLDQLPSPGNS